MGFPLGPKELKDHWKTGNGVGVEYRYSWTRRLSITAGVGYLAFGLDDKKLADDFNPKLEGRASFDFSGATFKTGEFHIGFRFSLTDPDSPVCLFVDAGGALYLLYQEDLISEQDYPQKKIRDRIALGKSESAPGVQGGIGIRIRIHPSVVLSLAARGHAIFSKDHVGDEDLDVRSFSRAQGRRTDFIVFQSGLGYQF
jgi:hypothetical protein